MPALTASRVVEQVTGSAAVEAAAWQVVHFVDGGFDGGEQRLRLNGVVHALGEAAFEVADGFFHGAVVGRVVRRVVQREHPVKGKNGIDLAAVEWGAIVAFEEQWGAVSGEGGIEEGSDGGAVLMVTE